MITWKSRKQSTKSRSSTEAEYRALAVVTNELLWIKQLLRAFEIDMSTSMALCDSKSAIQLANDPTTNVKSKHNSYVSLVNNCQTLLQITFIKFNSKISCPS